ncbi:cobalamin biosynthesis bifunctional protein CbiET [Nonomuraea aridisoli]|uniref:Cobalamin biosynthesis bifunctional protein CbiET n=1 Tax=Nonomuraea aridisoli TaxID=2070368 RepID=A0A2W2DW72_9ACTN|nr:cobalamin biosynthesis bifunctional protein CbiET [Nonomuraea aridisoli]
MCVAYFPEEDCEPGRAGRRLRRVLAGAAPVHALHRAPRRPAARGAGRRDAGPGYRDRPGDHLGELRQGAAHRRVRRAGRAHPGGRPPLVDAGGLGGGAHRAGAGGRRRAPLRGPLQAAPAEPVAGGRGDPGDARAGQRLITVVGIGADGWDGLAPASRRAVEAADVLMGAPRQLDLVPPSPAAERVVWPSPLLPALPDLLRRHAGREICVLASGDPMFCGIGSTLVRLLGSSEVRVLPHVSSLSLACARLGWPVEQVDVVSLVGRPAATLNAAVLPGRRLVVLGSGVDSPSLVAGLVSGLGYGPSPMTVLCDLGAACESVTAATAGAWTGPARSALNVIAVECVPGPEAEPLARVPGLPDAAYEHDGQLTKREVRAVSLSRLAPLPGELLWDVGAGAGSIAVEWLRSHPSCAAVAIESHADRAAAIARNADRLGVPGLRVVEGRAPAALAGLPAPDAVFVGGGATVPGLLETCWDALRPGGRLVVNAVTLESEAVVAGWYARLGGDLVRLAVQRASPVGSFTGWRAAMPVTVWSVTRKDSP